MANIIRFGGGAGGGLAIEVVGGTTKPANPKENTIWVNTDVEIGAVSFSPNAPAIPAVGDVWVNTTNKYNSNGTNASTNLIRVNDNPYLEINVLNISQWDGSAWVTRDGSAIYANGAWTSMALWIWNYGTENEAYPIKWGAGTGGAIYIDSVIKPNSPQADGSLVFSSAKSTNYAMVMVNVPVDFTNYNTYAITIKASRSNTARIGTCNLQNPYLQLGQVNYVALSSAIPTEQTTYNVDISSWTHTGYPAVYFASDSSSVAVNVYLYLWCFTA